MTSPVLRRAERADAPALIQLIIALADFEKLPPPDAAAQQRLLEHGFGERPRFESWLACVDGAPVGYAIIFETYSTFLARPTLYVEDVFVLPDYRRRGIGKALFAHCIRLAQERDCGRVEWTCLDWNTKAQCFYEGIGAKHMGEWYLYRMTREGVEKFLRKSRPAV
ncbi:MAG: GNAT family N-acetyltransferase [Verrucomicrobiota bacterium]